MPYNLLHAVEHAGGIVLCAYLAAEMVGFVASFQGTLHGKRIHWSHMAAVHPAFQGQGIGLALKRAQREAALGQGISAIAWTFDPLRWRNANFNFRVLGGTARTLLQEHYGEMTDGLNQGLVSDRFEFLWALKDRRTLRCLAGERLPLVQGPLPGVWALRAQGGQPEPGIPHPANSVLLELPLDIDAVRRADLGLARAWYLAFREAVQPWFRASWQVDGLARPQAETFAYVLVPPVAWVVYLLETADGTLYTGITNQLERRLQQHNQGKGARYTATRRPVSLLAAWQTANRAEASRLENLLKKRSRAQKLALVTEPGQDFQGAPRIL
ncbi:MAG: GNAT family N-acetyltransferase [Anaerolineae bacterium]|nr:GNAT family N-acetyltransferase [Anaerolineae bacterium]